MTVARDTGIILILVAAAELILRLAAPIYGRQVFDREFTGSYPLEINSEDFRGALVPAFAPAGETRVLALGDSATFGIGVSAGETWPTLLGRIATATLRHPVSVINAGMPAAGIAQLRYAYETKWRKFHPSVVAVLLTGNMVSLSLIRKDEPVTMPVNGFQGEVPAGSFAAFRNTVYRAYHQFALPSFLSINTQRVLYQVGLLNHTIDPAAPYGLLLAHGWRQGGLDPKLSLEAWQRTSDDLAALRDAVRKDGAKLIVSYLPPRFLFGRLGDNEKRVPLERMTIDPLVQAEEISRKLGIQYVDSKTAIIYGRIRATKTTGHHDPLYLLFDYGHLNPEGHRAIAAQMSLALSSAALIR